MPADNIYKLHIPPDGVPMIFDLGDVTADELERAQQWLAGPTRRKPPCLDPVKSAAKVIAKNPNLVARVKPDGTMEIAAADSAPAQNLDAGDDDADTANKWDRMQ